MNKGFPFATGKRGAPVAVRFGGMKIVPLLALAAIGCGDKFSAADKGAGGTGSITPGASGAAEISLAPPNANIPNIGARTACSAGTTGTYTYLLASPSSELSAQERVARGMKSSGGGFAVSCFVSSNEESIFVSASISGTDSNSRHVPSALSLSGTVPLSAGWGALDSGSFESDDTGELNSDPNLSTCVLENAVLVRPGAITFDFSCPVLVGDDASAGCQARGAVSLSGCDR